MSQLLIRHDLECICIGVVDDAELPQTEMLIVLMYDFIQVAIEDFVSVAQSQMREAPIVHGYRLP